MKSKGDLCLLYVILKSKHSHKKRKDSLETRAVLLIFLLKLEISVVAVQVMPQNSKNGCLLREFFCGDDFDAVLDIFRSYRYDANASEAVEKIAADEKDYHKCFLSVIVCIATAYQYE